MAKLLAQTPLESKKINVLRFCLRKADNLRRCNIKRNTSGSSNSVSTKLHPPKKKEITFTLILSILHIEKSAVK